ncbi:MAG: pantothenate kinase, partial [Chloroflexi bacterium CG_4_8_14_3_um_filter_45_15]
EKELGEKSKVVATGGYAHVVAQEIPIIEIVNPDLVLTGLRLIYEMNREGNA